ncbi:hypothetical protein GF373_07705 [bacterium]|nr:hypothetical protein [bacterium]
MNIENLYNELDGALYIRYEKQSKTLCAWYGGNEFKYFNNQGELIDSLFFEEPVENLKQAKMIMLEHLEGVDQDQEA